MTITTMVIKCLQNPKKQVGTNRFLVTLDIGPVLTSYFDMPDASVRTELENCPQRMALADDIQAAIGAI